MRRGFVAKHLGRFLRYQWPESTNVVHVLPHDVLHGWGDAIGFVNTG
jgi:hypothetical protein